MGTTRCRRGNVQAPQQGLALPFGNRRSFLAAGVASIAACTLPRNAAASAPLRLGTTAVFLDDQLQLLDIWRADLQAALKQDIQFVQRRSYGEIVDLLLRGQIDAAWICGYPYVLNADKLKLLVVPQYQGKPQYRSYLIVPKEDRSTAGIADLRERVFAYSDPLSNSGFLVPRTELLAEHQDPLRFFSKAFFTFAHSKVVEAVAAGLASGGAVDGYVWDSIASQHGARAAGTRVAWRSPEYGFPPVVVGEHVADDTALALRDALLQMHARSDGRLILKRLFLDRFVEGPDSLYDGIRGLVRTSAGENPARDSA
ncbi:ABC transporter substrate-binding protein [Achromobacter marplatensis]|uniref:ABC transporter substrate-binding protein n=3 Tax=Achromobacter TaxID=222 RepID=A0A424WC80_ALCXX|nr:PhnD/SsuA/transferrin family substrate-binding protein [Achromobacter xylosoxidans]OWT61659.1 ABC transporter substrate-binding protein [Achromobacter marplatensis]PND32427.1 ABC transporter substrate-binding protein [Achromobacter pulmonis]QYJ20267.1 PhnD/SsuA/transferrin family substrate-binding protein [Achromobacter sp. ES-001]MBC9906521.1 PhnD/SsuA/transferrin family substrate-binding protein [Achromobacter xylosoxidans]MBD0870085.1 PhnD/SsuA/transferrin family substrate-binding protei